MAVKLMLNFRTQAKSTPAKRKLLPASLRIRPQILDGAYSSVEDVLLSQGTTEQGLSDVEAQERLIKRGPNEVTAMGSAPLAWQFLKNFGNPFIGLLCVLSLVSVFLGNLQGTVLILAMVGISVLMRFIQEFRSNRTVSELRALVGATVTVRRVSDSGQSRRQEIPLREVVTGDIVVLSAGDMVPGDVRMLSTRDLFVSQSVLTGEAGRKIRNVPIAWSTNSSFRTGRSNRGLEPGSHGYKRCKWDGNRGGAGNWRRNVIRFINEEGDRSTCADQFRSRD
jgi:magnesium-transporting ATPase (P-type)